MTRDITAEKLDLGIEISGLGLGEVDYITDTITLDERAAGFFNLPANTAIPRSDLHDRIHPEDRQEVEREVSCLLSPDSEGFIAVVHRVQDAENNTRWLSARKQVKFEGTFENGEPKPRSGLVAILDITEFKAAEARIKYLMGEVAHRSKNMLSIVQAIARLTAKNSDPEDFMRQLSERLNALSVNQAVLVEDEWTTMTMSRLAQSQMAPYSSGLKDRLNMSGPDIQLDEKAVQAIGMALHELATNALKYGALSNTVGTVDITWTTDGPPEMGFVIEWTESGGPAVAPPARKGFGDVVIRQMASRSVSGTVNLDYDPAGVRWRLEAPLENIRAS